jgi:hypothetical protein
MIKDIEIMGILTGTMREKKRKLVVEVYVKRCFNLKQR